MRRNLRILRRRFTYARNSAMRLNDLLPSVASVVKQQIAHMMQDFSCFRNSNSGSGKNSDEKIMNSCSGSQYASVEIEARLGTLHDASGHCLYDKDLILPTVLQRQQLPLWRFVPSVSKSAFKDIKEYAKENANATLNRPPTYWRNRCRNVGFVRQKLPYRRYVQILPLKNTIDVLYGNKLRVSYNSDNISVPQHAVLKAGPKSPCLEAKDVRERHLWPLLTYPEPLVCTIPKTRLVISFSALREEHMPIAQALNSIVDGKLSAKRIRKKKCASMILGNMWRVDLKRVETWNIPSSLRFKESAWLLENFCSPQYPGHQKPKVTHEVELELSTASIERCLAQDQKSASSDRFGDLIDSFVHNAQELASIPKEYA